MSTAVLLAYDPNNIKPGWVALLIVLALGIATFLLWRSMNTQLGRIRAPHQADLDANGNLRPRKDPSDETASTPESPNDPASAPDNPPEEGPPPVDA